MSDGANGMSCRGCVIQQRGEEGEMVTQHFRLEQNRWLRLTHTKGEEVEGRGRMKRERKVKVKKEEGGKEGQHSNQPFVCCFCLLFLIVG